MDKTTSLCPPTPIGSNPLFPHYNARNTTPCTFPMRDSLLDLLMDQIMDPTTEPTEDLTLDLTIIAVGNRTISSIQNLSDSQSIFHRFDSVLFAFGSDRMAPSQSPRAVPSAILSNDPTLVSTADLTTDPISDSTEEPTLDPTMDHTSDPTADRLLIRQRIRWRIPQFHRHEVVRRVHREHHRQLQQWHRINLRVSLRVPHK